MGSVVKGDLFDKVTVNTVARLVSYYVAQRFLDNVAQRFLDNLSPIYDGSFNQALPEDSSPAFRLLKIFKSVAFKHMFNHPEVEQLELLAIG
ncbi:MAG: Deoxyguanosinetriphosphate triphosphohydrolase [Sodalis sp.]|nr:MAG: Deoxyguanosinetriphosphate triphosphohydrolase [Sodalis sp.]